MRIVLDGTTGITAPDVDSKVNGLNYPDASSMGFRNRIINGDMRIDQRNNGAAVTVNTGNVTYTVDRWFAQATASAGAFTVQRSSVAPAGFTNSALITVTTTDASLAATDLYTFSQNVEGFTVSDLGWGTASAASITLSFWVRSSVTGTFGGAYGNSAVNRAYPFNYTINAANTWEQKSITVAGDTSGIWLTDNGVGLRLYLGLGVGSTYSGTAGVWAGSFFISATGATNLMATNGATFYITGVQLEAGSVATPFERRPYGTELSLCQRYYGRFQGTGSGPQPSFAAGLSTSTNTAAVHIQFPQTMRAVPTLSVNQLAITDSFTYDSTVSSINSQFSSTSSSRVTFGTSGGMTQYRPGLLIAQSGTSSYLDFSAEL